MRLQILETGHRPMQRLILGFMQFMSAGYVPGQILVMSYRRELFGQYLAQCLQEAMREAKAWSVGEVEIFAAFVSKLNQSRYLTLNHTAFAALDLGDPQLVAAVLENWRTAPINEKLRKMPSFLETLTLVPNEVGPTDIAALRAVGLSDAAIEEAIYVAFLFNVMDRLADAFNFRLPSAKEAQMDGRFLYHLGYSLASVPG